jgi:hypothetical protein
MLNEGCKVAPLQGDGGHPFIPASRLEPTELMEVAA